MGKRGRPARIIRCAKPAKCPKCANRNFLIVVYGYPSNEVIDEIDKYDIRGCCLPPYKKVRDKSGNYYHCPEPKYVCSNQDCRLEVFMRKAVFFIISNSFFAIRFLYLSPKTK